MSANDKEDWVDRVAEVAAALGFNRVRVRWKLDRLRRGLREGVVQIKGKVSHVGYRHKICPHCHSVNDAADRTCVRCGRRLHSRGGELLTRVGLLSPRALSISTALGVIMVLVYGRMILHTGGGFGAIVSMDIATLFRFGGSYSAAYHNGEWWRLLTSVFVHAGLWHLGFNLFALSQLGPFVEETFGRARMLVYFVLTGIVASLGSRLISAVMAMLAGVPWDMGISIGASGAIMGLVGVMAGWGQREGTSVGRGARNLALKWAVYTLIFGWIIGADNGAHAVGLISGGIFGLLASATKGAARPLSPVFAAGGILAALLVLGAAAASLLPMPSPLTAMFERTLAREARRPPAQLTKEACEAFRRGEPEAMKHLLLIQSSPHILFPDVDAWLNRQATLLCRAVSAASDTASPGGGAPMPIRGAPALAAVRCCDRGKKEKSN